MTMASRGEALPQTPGHAESEGQGQAARAAAGRWSPEVLRGGRAGTGGRGVRGRGLSTAPVPRVARAAAAGALGGAGARHRRARSLLPPMGRRAPRRPAIPRRPGVHARGVPLRGHLRALRQHRARPRVAPVSSFSLTRALPDHIKTLLFDTFVHKCGIWLHL
jgi:hypothetical protein